MANVITLEGWDKFGKKLSELPKNIDNRSSAIVKDAGLMWAGLAKRSAPKDQGSISRQISSIHNGMTAEVVSPARHSVFVEFGTKKRKQVPADLATYAASLPYAKTGDYYDFLNAILDWVKRKGISGVVNSYTGKKVGGNAAKENLIVLAEAIAFSIMRHGIKPQPFLFIHREPVKKYLYERVQKYLNTPQ